MAQKVKEIMTPNPIQLPADATVADAAKRMREADVGDVVVEKDGKLCGILTDRDIVVRVIGAGKDPATVRLEEVCSDELVTAKPDQDVDQLVQELLTVLSGIIECFLKLAHCSSFEIGLLL